MAASRSAIILKMPCERCEYLESELNRLERIHAGKLGELRAAEGSVHADEYNRLRIAESNARLDLEAGRGELNAHRRIFHARREAGSTQ